MLLIADLPHVGSFQGERCWVYALVDPRSSEVRYIGCSKRIQQRAESHALSDGAIAVRAWRQELRGDGHSPRVYLLEDVPVAHRRESELRWIQLCLSKGARLLNRNVNTRKSK